MTAINLQARIQRAARLINEGRCKVLNSAPAESFFVVEVIGNSDTYVATVTPQGCVCTCIYGRNTAWGWSSPCQHALAAAGHVDLDVPIPDSNDNEGDEEE